MPIHPWSIRREFLSVRSRPVFWTAALIQHKVIISITLSQTGTTQDIASLWGTDWWISPSFRSNERSRTANSFVASPPENRPYFTVFALTPAPPRKSHFFKRTRIKQVECHSFLKKPAGFDLALPFVVSHHISFR